MIEHLTRFARIVFAIRQGGTVTSGPYVEDKRGGQTITEEWFRIGQWRVTREDELMHRLRHEFVKNGRSTVADNDDATDWTPQAMLQASALWNDEALEALPELPAPGVDPVVDQIMALADGGWHQFGARPAVRVVADPKDADCPWTFEDRDHKDWSPLRPLHDGLGEIVFYKRR